MHLTKQRYKLGLGMVVEVTQSEIAEVTLAYSSGGRSQLEVDSTLR